MAATSLANRQQETVSFLAALNNGHVHPYLFNPTEYHEILSNISIYNNFASIFGFFEILRRIMKVQYTNMGSNTIIKVSIPLPKKEPFTVSKVYVLPIHKMNRTYSIISKVR